MANPVLTDKIFKDQARVVGKDVMTIRGTLNKAILMLILVFASAAYTWQMVNQAIDPSSVSYWMWGGLIVGFILAMIISFKPNFAPFLAPIYAIAQGFFLGAISAIYNNAFGENMPGIVTNAVLLTFLAAFVMFAVYRFNIIKVDGKFTKIMMIAIGAVLLFYVVQIIAGFFGANLTMLNNSSPLSIGINLVIVGIAAFCLLLDYNFIEKSSAAGAPKYMEWYGAFALMVTLIWLYLEILKLLGKFSNRN